jgi:hypothetical protein
MLVDDLGNVVYRDVGVEGAIGINDNDGSQSAEAEAAGLNNADLLSQTCLFDLSTESVLNSRASGRSTSRTATT